MQGCVILGIRLPKLRFGNKNLKINFRAACFDLLWPMTRIGNSIILLFVYPPPDLFLDLGISNRSVPVFVELHWISPRLPTSMVEEDGRQGYFSTETPTLKVARGVLPTSP